MHSLACLPVSPRLSTRRERLNPVSRQSTLGLFIIFFAICSTLVRLTLWLVESQLSIKGRTIATFKLRSKEMAAVRMLLAQGKSNEALTYMQGLSSATKQ